MNNQLEKLGKYYEEIYLPLHKNKWNRLLHILGTALTFMLAIIGLVTQTWWLLVLAPFAIYPFAWLGHLFLEKNKPAAWTNLFFARLSDWLMCIEIIAARKLSF